MVGTSAIVSPASRQVAVWAPRSRTVLTVLMARVIDGSPRAATIASRRMGPEGLNCRYGRASNRHRRLNEPRGHRLDTLPLIVAETSLVDQRLDQRVLVSQQGPANGLAAGQRGRGGDVYSRLAHNDNLALPAPS